MRHSGSWVPEDTGLRPSKKMLKMGGGGGGDPLRDLRVGLFKGYLGASSVSEVVGGIR